MSVTMLGITAWLWKQNKPDNILGKRENRKLLLVRALGGFLGVFGLYCKPCAPHPQRICIPLTVYQILSGT